MDAEDPDRGDDALIGRTIAGKFRIDTFLGGGAMGAVYRARQVALEKDVAIKLLRDQYAGDPTFVARFEREAKAASRLDHPNSIRVLDFGRDADGLLYIAMEYVDGRDLYQVLRDEWPLPPARVVSILSQSLAALAVAHEMGIVHRDLKPENIMLLRGTDDEGRPADVVKVCDFGIAKLTDQRDVQGGRKLTSQGFVVGTPEYMSPEQGRGEELDLRSDLYSMGVILYQMLTGRVPFEAESALGVVLKHVTDEPAPPHARNPAAHPRLEAVCLRAMRKKRDERYASAREMRAEVRSIVALEALAATQDATIGHAKTAPALDSSPVQVALRAAALTAPKATAPGTVSTAATSRTSRGSTAVAAGALLVAVLGVGAWQLKVRGAPSSPTGAMVVAEPAPPQRALDAPANVLPSPSPDPPQAAPAPRPVAPATPAPGPSKLASKAAPAPVKPAIAEPVAAVAPVAVPAPSPTPEPVPATPPAAAPPAVIPPPPPPAAAAVAFDSSHARVDWAVASAGGGATPSAVQRALSRRAGAWTQCYRTGLEGRTAPVEGHATLHLSTDEAGNVVSASVRGLDALPGVKSCVSAAARVHVDGVDTGDAWAEVQLTFTGGA